MKFVMGSRPALFLQVSRPLGQPNAAERSAGVSETKSPLPLQPPWNVWYSPIQCPTSWVAVSPRL